MNFKRSLFVPKKKVESAANKLVWQYKFNSSLATNSKIFRLLYNFLLSTTREQHVRELTNLRRSNDVALWLCDMPTTHAYLGAELRSTTLLKAITGVLKTTGKKVSSPSFLSILQVFLPDNSSISFGPRSSHMFLFCLFCFKQATKILQPKIQRRGEQSKCH